MNKVADYFRYIKMLEFRDKDAYFSKARVSEMPSFIGMDSKCSVGSVLSMVKRPFR